MKKILSDINLLFFRDKVNKKWGVSPLYTANSEIGFDPIWDGEFIFHDVFEHSHEGKKYFRGSHFLNIGGEMVASGALYYFLEDLEIEQEDDFDKIYKGEISKSGAAILPSKRVRKLPEKIITAEDNEAKESIKQTKQPAEKDSIPTDNKTE